MSAASEQVAGRLSQDCLRASDQVMNARRMLVDWRHFSSIIQVGRQIDSPTYQSAKACGI